MTKVSNLIKPLLPENSINIFFEGAITNPQLNHPEGICIDEKGFIWCGGEAGEIYKIDSNGQSIELVESTNGFILGLNFDNEGNLYLCDNKHKAIFRYNPLKRELKVFSSGTERVKMRFPNFPLVDEKRKVLYVSDSYEFQKEGPGIWRIDLDTGKTELWCNEKFNFANGMALSNDNSILYVAESWGRCISKIQIDDNGNAINKELYLELPNTVPDGLAMTPEGILYITSYEPSQIYRIDTTDQDNHVELVVEDPDAHLLCHPTNCVIQGNDLYTSNLGRWHISHIDISSINSDKKYKE